MHFGLQKSCKESAHFSAALDVNINILRSHRESVGLKA